MLPWWGWRMRTQHARDILFLDCQISAEPEMSPVKPMDWIAGQIRQLAQDAGKMTYWSRDKRRKVIIRDVEIDADNQVLWLLLYSNDADAPDASFAHLQTDVQREEPKAEGEGRPESAHLAISLEALPDKPGRHLCLLEEAKTLPRPRVEQYLNFLLRQIRKDDTDAFRHPDRSGERDAAGNPKLVPYRNSIELMGHLSDDFQTDIEAGQLLGITLETGQRDQIGFGEGRRLIPTRKIVKLTPRGSWKDDAQGFVREALNMGRRQGLETARIVFTSADKTSHTSLLDTETGNVMNEGYIKRVRLHTKELFLPEASTQVHLVLRQRLLALIQSHLRELRG